MNIKKQRKKEYYEKRFGLIAIEKGFIKPAELVEALQVQVLEEIEKGTHRQIGEILLDMDIMDATQIEETVKTVLKGRDRMGR